MAPKIFLTGATGYIGGSVFHTLYTHHPDYDYTLLLRSGPSPSLRAAYPNAKFLHGDYDSLEVLASAARAADIVVHNGNSDHVASLRALLAGLATPQPSATNPKRLIHLSGTGLVADWQRGPYGTANPRVYSDDFADTLAVLESGDHPLHGETECVIHEAWEKSGGGAAAEVRTAVVRPPDIYGRGIGPGRKSSFWVPWFVREIVGTGEEKGTGAAFYVGEGGNRRGWVHLEDVVDVYLRLVESAVAGKKEGWGRDGYYHTTTQEYSQLEVAEAVGKILYQKGLIKDKEPKQISLEQVDNTLSALGYPLIGRYLFASNARTSAKRAKEVLGWDPKAPSLWEVLEQDIDDAIESMGDRAYWRLGK